ncbi:MAG: hypothetical protein LAP39_01200 [Acidobacteriia bacterium]|nr:hypothetical protein [Terriglobia bacterium]
MPPHVECDTPAFGNSRHDLVPAARVETSGVQEEHRWFGALTSEDRERAAVDINKLRASYHLRKTTAIRAAAMPPFYRSAKARAAPEPTACERAKAI